MRDGIYKIVPVSRWWKSVLHSCERKAERGEMLERLAEKATEKDAHQEITPKFLKKLMRIISLDESSLPGLGQLQNIRDARELGGMNMPLENDLLAKAKFLDKSGLRGQDLKTEALAQVLIQRQHSIFLQAQSHYLNEAGKQAGPFLSALRDAQGKVPVREIADRILKGERQPISRMRRAIDVDYDDLSAPR